MRMPYVGIWKKEKLPEKNMKLKALSLVIFVYVLFMFDQITKWLIIERLFKEDGQNFISWLLNMKQGRLDFHLQEINPFFNLVMVWNKGVSFGMFANDAKMSVILLSVFACLMALVFAVWFMRTTSDLVKLSSILIISGALGNVWDRLRFGAVADFLDFHAFGWHYPAFNVADSCIVIGVGILLFKSIFLDGKNDKISSTE